MTNSAAPEWDERQRAVIQAAPAARLVVVAGPGEGKTAVACARIANLVRDGVAPTRVLLISFTRTAVAELRARIGAYMGDPRAAAEVQLSTIDAHAWQLRQGFESAPAPSAFRPGSYDASIEAIVELLRAKEDGLVAYIESFEHVLVDEAQDVVGSRAELIWALVQALPPSCGVTVFTDPAQAIYGFTEDAEHAPSYAADLADRLLNDATPPFLKQPLGTIYRVNAAAMRTLFSSCREVALVPRPGPQHLTRLQNTIAQHATEQLGTLSHQEVATWCKDAPADTLVLFRHRVDALCASSYCAKLGVSHRLRMSGAPTIVHPWIGWMLWDATGNRMVRAVWDQRWLERYELAPGTFREVTCEIAWAVLHRLARVVGRSDQLDLEQLRAIVSRPRPPLELCVPDWGWDGPTLGTIHASKGRESTQVALLVFDEPPAREAKGAAAKGTRTVSVAERNAERERLSAEGRVLYVGATRARDALRVGIGRGARGGTLESGRSYRYTATPGLTQFEVGRDGDVDRVMHLSWPDAVASVARLARLGCAAHEVYGEAREDWGWRLRLFLRDDPLPVGQFSANVTDDRKKLWKKGTTPGRLNGVQVVGASTVALRDDERGAVGEPFRTSGFALAPVVRGFAFQHFYPRKGG